MAEKKTSAEAIIKDIRRRTQRKYSAEDKIRIVIEGLRGESMIAESCCHVTNMFYRTWLRCAAKFAHAEATISNYGARI